MANIEHSGFELTCIRVLLLSAMVHTLFIFRGTLGTSNNVKVLLMLTF